MTEKDIEFQKRLMATFRVEAEEHVKNISSGLLELEKAASSKERTRLVETVFREAHSLKGAARAVNRGDIESLCQAMESLFARMKKDELALSVKLFDLLQESSDCLFGLISEADTPSETGEKYSHKKLIGRLAEAAQNSGIGAQESGAGRIVGEQPPTPDPRTLSPVFSDTIRVSTAKLSSVMLQAEEMLSAKLAALQHAVQLRQEAVTFVSWEKEWAKVLPVIKKIRRSYERAALRDKDNLNKTQDHLPSRVYDFLEWNSSVVKTLEQRFRAEAKSAERDSIALCGMVDTLLEDMKKALMFPFSSLFEILPKIARDISREHGKDVDIVIQGADIEIDRRILEEMKDPFVHLIRNCIDHGIEMPLERESKKKSRRGTITVTVSTRDDKVEILVADDGAGISIAGLRSAVRKLGAVSKERAEEFAEDELLQHVFQSGISTSPIITEISGRGLGLAIVREKVEKFGGTVSLSTQPDEGTEFRIVLPLTVATFHGILVRVSDRLFVIPTTHVQRAVRVKREDIKSVENRETIVFNKKTVSLARLHKTLGLSGKETSLEQSGRLPAVVLNAADSSVAFLVDEVIGEQEVLLKAFGKQLSRVRNVAGATVLGSGKVVPILNVPDLIKSAAGAKPEAAAESAPEEEKRQIAARSVLVVEDSITSRTLLKNILESDGYNVTTAVDGLDAFTRLKSGHFDVVVSDVDMPRMNGFDLTSKIRADKKLADVPVVLVTALQSREDREKGIDVGANAYIVKSSFDQGNLLEIIKRLV
ncbi:MAG: hybrid sensor histidine kinase/response regulator [Nitrospirae bacterium]|nr:MAG: hybrid sensor histidine kinase/response regulator [Nitrospirota bacterium]